MGLLLGLEGVRPSIELVKGSGTSTYSQCYQANIHTEVYQL